MRAKALALRLLVTCLNPKSVNQAWEIAKQRQNYVENESPAKAFTNEYAQRGKNNRKNNTPETHNFSIAIKMQVIVKKGI